MRIIVAMGAVVLAGVIGIVQALFAQAPAFEVASVKVNTSRERIWSMQPSPGGRVSLINVPLRIVIRAAFGGLQEYELVGGPGWLDTDRFDIVARAEGNPSQSQLLLMIRTLLADRFQLQLREDTRELPIYGLVTMRSGGPSGPRLRRATPCFRTPMNAPAQATPPPEGLQPCGFKNGVGTLEGRGVTLDTLAFSLSSRVGRLVVDRTGLAGEFDLNLTFVPDVAASDLGVSLFTAVQEQLGLRLEPARGQVKVMMIDRVERPLPD